MAQKLETGKKNVLENKAEKPDSYISKTAIFGAITILSLLVIAIFFISKPGITGNVILAQEKLYDDKLNLQVNESANTTWAINKAGNLNSIKASGSIIGNGSVKIYIEKEGKKYLIYKNK